MATARDAQRALKRSPIYRFGNREVDTRLRQIQADGELVEAQPKAFDLLVYLIENRDRVVDKDELLEQLWSGTIVSDSALTQIVRKARSLAGDDGNRQDVIRTIQRHGFRFVAVVQAQIGESSAGAAQANATAEPSVAVLPFADMSPDHDQEYFCDGMVEEIITELTRVPGLRVAARTSSFAFKHRADDVREIGRQLGVNFVLEGSVRKAGDTLRVTAQLIDAATGFHLWSERWDRKLEDMLAIQGEIGAANRRGLAQLAERLRRSADRHVYGRRSLRARVRTSESHEPTEPTLRHGSVSASSRDRSRVRARVGGERSEPRRVVSHDNECETPSRRGDERGNARHAAWRAFGGRMDGPWRCDRDRPWLCRRTGSLRTRDRARSDLVRSTPLLRPHLHRGREFQLAAEQFEAAAAARPDDYQALVFARQAYRSLGRAADERSAAARQVAAAERALRADPTDARALSLSSGSLVVLGRIDEARAWTRRSCELEPDEPYVHYNAACVLAQLGQVAEALAALESGTEGGRLCRPSWVEHDEDLASLRGNPRFEALLAKMRIDDPAPVRNRARRGGSTE